MKAKRDIRSLNPKMILSFYLFVIQIGPDFFVRQHVAGSEHAGGARLSSGGGSARAQLYRSNIMDSHVRVVDMPVEPTSSPGEYTCTKKIKNCGVVSLPTFHPQKKK